MRKFMFGLLAASLLLLIFQPASAVSADYIGETPQTIDCGVKRWEVSRAFEEGVWVDVTLVKDLFPFSPENEDIVFNNLMREVEDYIQNDFAVYKNGGGGDLFNYVHFREIIVDMSARTVYVTMDVFSLENRDGICVEDYWGRLNRAVNDYEELAGPEIWGCLDFYILNIESEVVLYVDNVCPDPREESFPPRENPKLGI